MEDENGVTRSIIDELHSSDIQLDQVECETRVIPSIIYGLYSLDILRYQMEGESGVTQSVIDELHSSSI